MSRSTIKFIIANARPSFHFRMGSVLSPPVVHVHDHEFSLSWENITPSPSGSSTVPRNIVLEFLRYANVSFELTFLT